MPTNDAGAEYPKRSESERVFLDFFNVSGDSPVRGRAGVYDAHIYGPPGKRVQIILLDTRYFRGPLREGTTNEQCPRIRYVPNEDPDVTMLGEAQWSWLEEQLRKSAEIRVLASSIQVIPEEHCFEKWANLPRERKRLFRLIRDTQASGVILISGDRHLAELSRLEADVIGYPLFELTSSGMNSAGAGEGDPNRYRVTPDNYRRDNFGTIVIDWARSDPLIRLQIRGVQGEAAMEHAISLSELALR